MAHHISTLTFQRHHIAFAMDSERQSLLEQKRQRLQELKRRRLLGSPTKELSSLEVDNILEAPQVLQSPSKVDVAVQTDVVDTEFVIAEVGYKARVKDLEEFQCNQAVQTVESYFDSETKDDPNQTNTQTETDIGIESIADLDVQIEDSNAALKSLYQEEVQEATVFDEFDVSFSANGTNAEIDDFDPFKLLARIESSKGTTNRAIAGIDVSTRFPGLVVISYGSTGSPQQLNGLAKVINFNKLPPAVEFALECNTSISKIKFDSCNNKRIIGGLADGRIVVWDLSDTTTRQINETEYVVLPTISSPLPNPIEYSNAAHNTGISSLTQLSIENNDSIVASSYSGAISLWSSNMLASPKCSPVILKSTSTDEMGSIQTEFIGIEGVVALRGDLALQEASFAIDQHKFLSNLIVLSPKGKLYRLGNDMELIRTVYGSGKDSEGNVQFPTSVSSFLEGKYFITTHLNSTLKLWLLSNSHPLLDIPTKDLIICISVRPQNDFQFVTLALSQTPIVQFWDLKIRLRCPIVDIAVSEGLSPTKIAFDIDGKQIYLGFLDGSISVYEIDDAVLKDISRVKRNPDLDSGLQDIY